MEQLRQITNEDVLERLRRDFDCLNTEARDALLWELVQSHPAAAMQPARPVAAAAERKRAVTLCRWADDAGRTAGGQLLEVAMNPRVTKIAKTHQATGKPLLTNGFLGADLIHVPAGQGFAPHTHPGDHLLFVVGGTGSISAAGEILRTEPGQVYMVDGAQPHAVGAITDHVLLSIGVTHQPLASLTRQELRPFEDLHGEDGRIHCRICGVAGIDRTELTRQGCVHGPVAFDEDE